MTGIKLCMQLLERSRAFKIIDATVRPTLAASPGLPLYLHDFTGWLVAGVYGYYTKFVSGIVLD